MARKKYPCYTQANLACVQQTNPIVNLQESIQNSYCMKGVGWVLKVSCLDAILSLQIRSLAIPALEFSVLVYKLFLKILLDLKT